MNIIEHLSPNHSPRKPGVLVDTLVIHHTATSADASGGIRAANWLCDDRSHASAHYLVPVDGSVLRLVPDDRTAWHAGLSHLPWDKPVPGGSVNARSIGIELVNPGDGKTPFTEAQYRALSWLVLDICKRQGWDVACLANGATELVYASLHVIGSDWRGPMGFILGHRDVAPGRKTDPADNFDWLRLRQAFARGVT